MKTTLSTIECRFPPALNGPDIFLSTRERVKQKERERERGIRSSVGVCIWGREWEAEGSELVQLHHLTNYLWNCCIHSHLNRNLSEAACSRAWNRAASTLSRRSLSFLRLWWIEPNANLQPFYMSMPPLPKQEHSSTSRFKMSASEHPASLAPSQSRLSQISAE